MTTSSRKTFCSHRSRWLTLGLALGISLGTAFDQLAIGLALGLIFGLTLQRRHNRP